MWSSNVDVHGSSVGDVEVSEGGSIIAEDTALVNELHWTELGNFNLKIRSAKKWQQVIILMSVQYSGLPLIQPPLGPAECPD